MNGPVKSEPMTTARANGEAWARMAAERQAAVTAPDLGGPGWQDTQAGRAALDILSPFVQRATAGQLPAKVLA